MRHCRSRPPRRPVSAPLTLTPKSNPPPSGESVPPTVHQACADTPEARCRCIMRSCRDNSRRTGEVGPLCCRQAPEATQSPFQECLPIRDFLLSDGPWPSVSPPNPEIYRRPCASRSSAQQRLILDWAPDGSRSPRMPSSDADRTSTPSVPGSNASEDEVIP